MINQRIKDYQIISKIGEGGMASVFLAQHVLLGTQVALKILNQEFVRNTNIRNRFLAEARNMAKMQHPNIVKVTDLIDAGDVVAIAMEYIEGETLKDYLNRQGNLTDKEIATLLGQMLDALDYVHQNRLVHRDVKPSNFMRSNDGMVKLLDFGIAKNLDAASSDYTSTGTTQQMGTIMYMSPEQVKSTKDVTPATDIYSMGVVLWQMVKGYAPYNPSSSGNFDIQSKIVHEPLPLTNTIWDSVIQKATDKREFNRFENCNAWNSIIKNRFGKINSVFFKNAYDEHVGTSANNVYSNNHEIHPSNNTNKFGEIFLSIMLILLIPSIGIVAYYRWYQGQNSKEEQKELVVEDIPIEVYYPEQIIGNQIWMTENLNVTHFNNGDIIYECQSEEEWLNACEKEEPAWCYYDNDPKNAERYGKLYNWYAVNDPRGLAPLGWHIPTHYEFDELETSLFGKAGKKLKSTSEWHENQNGNNESGFNGFPGGYREPVFPFKFVHMFEACCFWSCTMVNNENSWSHFLVFKNDNMDRAKIDKKSGMSVRCIKD
jgi:uncharacterized protein (TIGR02145 family)